MAPVAQLDRVLGYEPRGRAFESLRARHLNKGLAITLIPSFFHCYHIATLQANKALKAAIDTYSHMQDIRG